MQPVAILIATFCVLCIFCMFVSDVSDCQAGCANVLFVNPGYVLGVPIGMGRNRMNFIKKILTCVGRDR